MAASPTMRLLDDLAVIDPNFWKNGRLKTHDNWPFSSDANCKSERMAAAGFLFIGGNDDPDLVECFICAKQLNQWDSDDDPWSEHRKHMSACPYTKLDKQDELTWTVLELFQLQKEYLKNILRKKQKQAVSELRTEANLLAERIPQVGKKLRKHRQPKH